MGRGGAMLIPNEVVYTFWGFYVVPILVKIDQESAIMRMCTDEQTDRQTDAPMQTSFIICPMLHATADDYEQSQYPCQQNCKHKLIHV